MRLAGSRISANLPAALGSGSRQWTHRSGPLASGTRSHSPCLDGFSLRENDPRTARALAAGKVSPNKINFDRHSSFIDRCYRSKFAFKLGLRGGSLIALI